MKDKIQIVIEQISKPIVCIVLAILTVISGVTYAITYNMVKSKSQELYDMPISVSKEATSDEIVVETVDVEGNYRKTISELEEQLNNIINPQADLVEKTKKYFNVRYNFEGSQRDNKDKILNGVSDIVTETHYDDLKKELEYSGAGNMGASADNGYSCEVVDVFQELKAPSSYSVSAKSTSYINQYALVKRNSQILCYQVTFMENTNGWMINSVQVISRKAD